MFYCSSLHSKQGAQIYKLLLFWSITNDAVWFKIADAKKTQNKTWISALFLYSQCFHTAILLADNFWLNSVIN